MKKWIKKDWVIVAILLALIATIYSQKHQKLGAITVYSFKYADEKITKKAHTVYGKDFAITDNLDGTKTGDFYSGDTFYTDPVTQEVRIVKYATSTSPTMKLPNGAIDMTSPISFGTIAYADFSPSTDCRVNRDPASETWNTIITSAGQFSDCAAEADNMVFAIASATTDEWTNLMRSTFNFDTSSIGAGQTVLTGSFRVTGAGKSDTLGASPVVHLYGGDGTYAGRGNTDLASDSIAYANWTGTNTFTLDADGLANISVTGTSYFTFGTNYDCNGCSAPSWTSGANYAMAGSFVEDPTSGNRPLLTLTWGVVASADSSEGIMLYSF